MSVYINDDIAPDFATIFEKSYSDQGINGRNFYILRDDFYQVHKSFLHTGRETKNEAEKLFSRQPADIPSQWLDFARATAKYYCRVLELECPQWAQHSNTDDNHPLVFFPLWSYAPNVGESLASTPPEFLEFGFIYPEKALEIC